MQYYASWAIYGRDHKPWEMQLDKITHVNYAFFDVTAACAVTTLDSYADYDIVHTQLGMSWGDGTTHGNIGAFQRLRAQHPHLKLLLSLGGWTKSTYFSGCAKTAAKRATIVSTALQQLERSDFDGIDVDWECAATARPRAHDHARCVAHHDRAAARAPHARARCATLRPPQTPSAAGSEAIRLMAPTGPTTCCCSPSCARQWTQSGRRAGWS